MKISLPSNVRLALYIMTAIGTPLVGYLQAVGVIGVLEVGLWSAEVAVISALAAFNVTPDGE